ncbi:MULTISPECIES: phosphoesterase [Persephonella]|uniref:phosphoesterase n=1 Tax=Persephonella TaxID=182899 RepID=UPI001EE65691|nr:MULTISPECIES: phosphoesterase [Persephonella]
MVYLVLFFIIILFLTFLFYVEFRPIKKIKIDEKSISSLSESFPEEIYRYNVISHIHTQFSFDSLGKPSDIRRAMEVNEIDFVFVTDHDNDNYRFFEDGKVFAGIEKNTPDGRLLLLGNEVPVISHPNNFEFEHYRWKGEFKEDHLYEIIDIKDGIVWNKLITGLTLIKNILLYPFTRNILHKWNALIPLDKWVDLYFERAKGLKLIGGLDLHIKLVYQEHTHGILIPSYQEGFKWLVNKVFSKSEIKDKKDILEALRKGLLYISLKRKEGYFWGSNGFNIYLFWEKMPVGSSINCDFRELKTVKILKCNNSPVLVTEENRFSYVAYRAGYYHFEVYEYDFKIGNLYFGVRPVAVTNIFEVVNV